MDVENNFRAAVDDTRLPLMIRDDGRPSLGTISSLIVLG